MAKQFPEEIYVHFVEEESYEGGGFLSVEETPEAAIDGDGPTPVAVYKLVEVKQGTKSVTFAASENVTTIPADPNAPAS